MEKFEAGTEFHAASNQEFRSRKDVMKELHSLLVSKQQTGEPRFVIIHGPGAAGETEAALEFVYAEGRHSARLWLDASSQRSLSKSAMRCLHALKQHYLNHGLENSPRYKLIVDTIRLPPCQCGGKPITVDSIAVRALSKWLSLEGNDAWLLVLDNYDDPENVDISAFMSMPRGAGSVLITSRRADTAVRRPKRASGGSRAKRDPGTWSGFHRGCQDPEE